MNRYKCGNCFRFIKWEARRATAKQMDEDGYPEEYDVPICSKCGELSGLNIERSDQNA